MSHLIYSTFRPSVTNAFKNYRKQRDVYGPDSIEARKAWSEYSNECDKFHLNAVAEYEKQLENV